jgi:hypothetical protein
MRLPFTSDSVTSNDDIVGYLEDQYKEADAKREPYVRDWYTNIAYLAGNQWESYEGDLHRHGRKLEMPAHSKVKLVANVIYPLVRQCQSSILQNLAQQIAIPATSDKRDIDAAAVATDFLQARMDADKESEIRAQEIQWAMTCGRAWRKTYWDPDLDSEGIAGKMKKAGDIASSTLSPFHMHVCPYSDNYSDPLWIIESDVRDIDEINDLFPGKDVEGEDVADTTRWIDRLLANIMGGHQSNSQRSKAAILKRLYSRPSAKNPKGKVWIWANGVLLKETELPEGVMPFVSMDWFPIPGRAYPMSLITPLRDMQKEINTTLSQLVELKNRQLRGDIIVSGIGQVTQSFAVDDEGRQTAQKVISVPPQTQFELMKYNINTQEAEILLNRMKMYADDAAGIHEPTQGKELPRAATATQIQLLKESDLQGLTLFRIGFDQAYCKVAQQKLLVAKNHYEIPRLIRCVGESNAVKSTAFIGADLRGTEDVRPRSTPIVSESIRRQMIEDASAAGMFDFTGNVNMKLNKVNALINLGIPDIEEDIEQRLGMSIDDLKSAAQIVNQMEVKTSVVMAQAQLMEAEAKIAMISQAAQAQAQPQ